MTLSRKLKKSDEAEMSELNTFIKASLLLKREKVVPPEGPYPEWWLKVKKMLGMGACVNDVPLDHRLPMLEKGSMYASEAIQELEFEVDPKKKSAAMIYIHVALAVFRSCFYELFPEADMTVLCYLMAVNEVAQSGIPASDTLRSSLFVHCVANAFRRTRTGSENMNPEKIAKLSKIAIGAIAPKNPKQPTHSEIQKYCTLLLCMSSASLFCRSFTVARETLKPLITELPQIIDPSDVDLCSQMIDAYIIYTRCLTEENKMTQALDILKKLILWLNQKVDKIAPRKVVSAINRWRPELSSANNGMLWSTLTAYQLKLVKANPTIFNIEELAQLMLLMAAHQTHINQFESAKDAGDEAAKLISKLGPNTPGGSIGPLQLQIIRAWTYEGLAKKAKTAAEKAVKYKECWSCLSAALNGPSYGDESTQLAIMAKMSWIGEHLPNDASVAATLSAFSSTTNGITELINDPSLIKWGANLPNELLTPYWGLSF
jgi:hypothetical protein